jgi:tRNA(Ile)-lysidine synthase
LRNKLPDRRAGQAAGGHPAEPGAEANAPVQAVQDGQANVLAQAVQDGRSNVLAQAVQDGLRAAAQRQRKSAVTVCVAYSGGLDSTVLLHLLATLRGETGIALSALHVHHGISAHAQDWAAHCAAVCAALDVPFRIVRAQVSRAPRTSLEEEARRERYAIFAAAPEDVIALAHHADDQAETLLLQLLRGAGPKGLAGMPLLKPLPKSAPAGAQRPLLLRPLLAFPRVLLAAHAGAHQLRWIEDESNGDLRLKRNFLRHQVMPLLQAGFPAPLETMARAARHQAEAARLLDALADLDLVRAAAGAALDIAVLKSGEDERLRNALRRWLDLAGLRQPAEARLAALVRALRESTNDTRLRWEHEGAYLVRRKGLLHLERE